jgi:nicotinamide mononucleotide transporter
LNVLDSVLAALAAVSIVEWVAVALALAYLLLAIRQNPWCWACAIASAALYLVLFSRAALVMQAALQVYYVGMAVYGWHAWRGGRVRAALRVSRWPMAWHVAALAAVAAVTAVNVALVRPQDPWVGVADAAIAWASVLTTWLVARKVLENWLYWIVIDLAAAWLYASQGLYATAVLFVLYAALAVQGYRRWRIEEYAGESHVVARA